MICIYQIFRRIAINIKAYYYKKYAILSYFMCVLIRLETNEIIIPASLLSNFVRYINIE